MRKEGRKEEDGPLLLPLRLLLPPPPPLSLLSPPAARPREAPPSPFPPPLELSLSPARGQWRRRWWVASTSVLLGVGVGEGGATTAVCWRKKKDRPTDRPSVRGKTHGAEGKEEEGEAPLLPSCSLSLSRSLLSFRLFFFFFFFLLFPPSSTSLASYVSLVALASASLARLVAGLLASPSSSLPSAATTRVSEWGGAVK